ncbi:hypothetical protein [Mycolicibacterium sp. BiH015]|uniref:hypothetical protein n=1 Tax=Mycolicibacterium sp. BiH015 TaxID=3018808 RepID=UPI002FD9AB36
MPSDDLEPRVEALEDQVRDLTARVRATEHDAAAARVLAGGADRDVGEIRGELRHFRQSTMTSLNAMRQGFLELRAEFGELRDHVDRGFAEMRGKLDATAAGQHQIVDLLHTIIEKPMS